MAWVGLACRTVWERGKVVPLGDFGDPRARACMHWVSDWMPKGGDADLTARATCESLVSETL